MQNAIIGLVAFVVIFGTIYALGMSRYDQDGIAKSDPRTRARRVADGAHSQSREIAQRQADRASR